MVATRPGAAQRPRADAAPRVQLLQPADPGAMSTAAIDLATLQLTGPKGSTLHADVLAALEDLSISQTITGASTVSMTLSDPHRTLLRSGLLLSLIHISVPLR